MEREAKYLEYIEDCMRNLQICGMGNPNADILIIGQEQSSHLDLSDESNYSSFLKSLAENYSLCLDKHRRDCPRPKMTIGNEKAEKIAATWENYQKLINVIYSRTSEYPDKIDFEHYAFTSELGNMARKHSRRDTETLRAVENRLEVMGRSSFINDFHVIILACSGYIVNNDTIRQIDDTFNVTFDSQEDNGGEYKVGNRNAFWTHHGKNNPEKLVIHTRQFSNGISDALIIEIAKKVKEHLIPIKQKELLEFESAHSPFSKANLDNYAKMISDLENLKKPVSEVTPLPIYKTV